MNELSLSVLNMGVSGCYCVMKYLVVLLNLIFWIVGLSAVVLAVWMLADPTFYLSMSQSETDYYAGLYLLLAGGALLLLIAFLGCCGALRESQCMLVTFFCCLLVVVVGEAAGAWWAAAQAPRLEQLVRDAVTRTVQHEYGRVESRTAAFDAIQSGLECCGATGAYNWAGSDYINGDKTNGQGISLKAKDEKIFYSLPASCCKAGIAQIVCDQARTTGITAAINPALHSTGCIDKVLETIKANMNIVIGVAIAVVSLEVLGLIFSICLCFAVKRSDRYKA